MATITGRTDLDVELMFPGLRMPVTAGPILRSTRWRGGLWVMYVESAEGDFVVEASDGSHVAGCLLFPSENYFPIIGTYGPDYGSNANWTSGQPATGVGGQNVVTMFRDGTRAFFKVYETEALVGGVRAGGSITYAVNEILRVSENGYLCNDSEAELIAAGVADPVPVGIVSAAPASRNGNRLGVDLTY